MKHWALLSLGALLFGHALLAQPAFHNLDFEEASFAGPPPDPQDGRYLIAEAMPGWKAYTGTNDLDLILHNNTFPDSAGISIPSPREVKVLSLVL